MPAPTDPGDFTAGTTAAAAAVNTRFQRLYTALAAGAIDATMLAPASQPSNGVYRTVAVASQVFTGAAGSLPVTTATNYVYTKPGNVLQLQGASLLTPVDFIYIAAADYAVTGLTTKIRLRLSHASNASTLNTTLTALLAPATLAGGVGAMTWTPGATTASAAIAAPAASGVATTAGTEVTLPADGAYMLFWVATSAVGTNHAGVSQVQVQVRNT